MVERKYTDLVGQKFNRLTVIAFSRREKNVDYWLCQCDCGEEKVVSRYELTSGGTKSCGCIRIKDLTGQRFGRWTVLSFSHKDKNNRGCWLCRCDCGNENVVSSNHLKAKNSTSCGCLIGDILCNPNFKNLEGRRFGRLFVIEFNHKKNRQIYYLCLCDCGKEKIINGSGLKNGTTQSCGCLRDERAVETHTGEKHYRWRGGPSKRQEYSEEWNESLRKEIRNRDQYKCRYPNCVDHNIELGRELSVHHIDGNKQNCEKWNLISLCNSHHLKIEHHPESWQEYFYAITNDYR